MRILTDIRASRSGRSRNWCRAKGEARNDGPVRASSKSRNDTAARQTLCDTVRPENCSSLDLRESVGQRTELVPRAAVTFSNPLPSLYFRRNLTLFVTRRIFDKLKTNTLSTFAFPNAVCTEEAAMEIFANLIRFIYRSEPPQPSAAPFDDGLAEIVRLIAREDPVEADAFPAETVADLTTSAR